MRSSDDTYSKEDLREMLLGMKLASLAVTDDKPATLKRVTRMNPWQEEALKLITGSIEDAHRPLSEILAKHFDLKLDAHIDECGMTKGGHFLDTQGYIAHNDKTIVLSYRCTTSVYDWLTNFSTTTTVWEVDEDYEQGFSGYCDCFDCFCGNKVTPRVHTGFYNNFLASLSLIKKHIEPLLGLDQPPRTLYVTGHSLGAGVATLATCYFLLKYDWESIPQALCSVTAGSPRTCGRVMRDLMDDRIHQFPRSKVRLHRVVRGKDVVSVVPPKALGFRHVSQAIVIDRDGKVTMPLLIISSPPASNNTPSDAKDESVTKAMAEIATMIQTVRPVEIDGGCVEHDDPSKYEKMVQKIPPSLRDHMPDFYLRPLLRVNGICTKTSAMNAPVMVIEESASKDRLRATQKMVTRMLERNCSCKA
ncbi:hypothetical protein MPSEU_000637200 [Mayamaea pseudoterrestris]|nr:hypothetical protein MPSEU_000637200 [Mayamaea pseudoterrestris]